MTSETRRKGPSLFVDTIGERIGQVLTVAAIAFLSFIIGTMVMQGDLFPSRYLKDAYRGGSTLYQQILQYDDTPLDTDLWARARTPEKGVTVYDPAGQGPGGIHEIGVRICPAGAHGARLIAESADFRHRYP